jgi:hypothetical protein
MMSEADARTLGEAAIQRGTMTRAELDAGLAADFPPVAAADASTQPASAASDEPAPAAHPPADPLRVYELDPAFDRPATPEAYKLPQALSAELGPAEIRAAQTLCFQARLPQALASDLFATADAYESKNLGEADIAMLTQNTMAALHRQFGDQTAAKVAQAQRLAQEVAAVNPILLDLLASGLGSDQRFVTQMVMHADRLYGPKAA